MNKRPFVIAPTALLVLAACTGTIHSAAAPPPTAQSFGEALCGALAGCCMAAGSFMSPDCSHKFPQSAVNQTLVYDAAAGQKCLDAIAAQPSTFCTKPPDECATTTVFPAKIGDRAPGDACETTSDCAPSNDGVVECGVQPETGDDPICEVKIRGKEGDPCSETKDINGQTSGAYGARLTQCWTADGLRCDHATSTCTKLHAIGASCPGPWALNCVDSSSGSCSADGRICAVNARCNVQVDGEPDALTGTCAPTHEAGEYCEGDSDCVSGACDLGHTCFVPVRDGGDCARDKECHRLSRCFTGHCVAADASSVVCPTCVCAGY